MYWPWKFLRPTTTGMVASEFETMSGHSRLFQWKRKAKTASVASAGPESGRMMRQKQPKRLAPSMRRGVFQFVRDGEEELPQEEDPERGERLGDYKALVSIHPVEFLCEDELRNDGDLGWDHQRTQVQEEEQISPPESQAGEGVGGKGRGHRLEDGDAPDHYQAVY